MPSRVPGANLCAMRTTPRRLFLPTLAALLALASAATGCGKRGGGGNLDLWNSSTIKQAKDRGKLVVLMEAEFRPFTFKEAGVLKGFDVDLGREIAKELGVEVEFRERAWGMLATELIQGKGDLVISGVTATARRALECSFSDPYFLTRTIALVAKPAADAVRTVKDLDDARRKIVVQKGSTGEVATRNHLPKAQLIPLETESACALEVAQGRADAFVYDEWQILAHAKDHPDTTRVIEETLSFEPYAIECRKGDPETLSWLNLLLSLMKRDGRLETLYARWVPGRTPPP